MELKRNVGSLPNLHELERVRRKLEIEQQMAKREQKLREEREACRDPEKLPIFSTQSSFNSHNLANNHSILQTPAGNTYCSLPLTNSTAITTSAIATTIGGSFGLNAGNSHFGGYGYVNFGSAAAQLLKHHHHHRHSLTRQRVMRTRSSGANYSVWDDAMIEHLSGYSPVASRSHRITTVTPLQVQAALAATRRRESVSSSVGANSIKRLITLNNRNYCRHKLPTNVRTKICKNFAFMAIAHGLICAILTPLIALQASNSIWHHKEKWIHVGPNIGSLLLSITFLISFGMSFLTTRLIRKLGYAVLIASCYIGMCLFLLCHLYPSIYSLIPAYIILGICLAPAWIAKISLVVLFASKLSCSQHECSFANSCAPVDIFDDHRVYCNRDQKIRRLVRWYQAAQDIGTIVGAIIASIILDCSLTKGGEDSSCFAFIGKIGRGVVIVNEQVDVVNESIWKSSTVPPSNLNSENQGWKNNVTEKFINEVIPSTVNYIYDMYNHNEQGGRICGSALCPIWHVTEDQATNGSFYSSFIHENGKTGGIALIIIYILFALIALILTIFPDKMENTSRQERVKGITDTLLFAGPMAYFIGTEQAYMLGDFMRAYVSCTLGLQMVAGALICMGVMQAIVSCTLSMLLRHVNRIVVIVAGFFFHACLLLVLSQWKPSQDDSALFYVIAASWGACNAMWETLLFALVTLTHTNHIPEVVGSLQALRFLGLGITFAAHGFLCENPKILFLGIILFISIPPYAMLEVRLEAQRKSQMVSL